MNRRSLAKAIVSIYLILNSTVSNLVPTKQCSNIQGIGNPINVFHQYFQQTMNVFNPSDKSLQIELIYYREQISEANIHRYVFKLKNSFAERWEYIGVVSVVPQNEIDSGKFKHYIVRYINTTRLNDISFLLGIYELYDKEQTPKLKCPKLKEQWLSYLIKNPYIPTDCRPIDMPDCVKTKELSKLFSATFEFLKNVLLKFGYNVTLGELGFNKSILQSYKVGFKEFPFILKAINQIEGMITEENEVDQQQLLQTSYIIEKPVCPKVLDTKLACLSDKIRGSPCLSEKDARALINYMTIHYMMDTKTILPSTVLDGKHL